MTERRPGAGMRLRVLREVRGGYKPSWDGERGKGGRRRPERAAPGPRQRMGSRRMVDFAVPRVLHSLLPFLPSWLERLGLVIGTLWFVNLVNFMDGLDWMTVAETVPVTAGIMVEPKALAAFERPGNRASA